MPSIGLSVKREATIQGIAYLVNNITGTTPIINRTADGANILWKEGQSKKIVDYLLTIGKKGKDADDTGVKGEPSEGLNVDLPLSPIIIPYVLRKFGIYLAIYTLGIVTISRMYR